MFDWLGRRSLATTTLTLVGAPVLVLLLAHTGLAQVTLAAVETGALTVERTLAVHTLLATLVTAAVGTVAAVACYGLRRELGMAPGRFRAFVRALTEQEPVTLTEEEDRGIAGTVARLLQNQGEEAPAPSTADSLPLTAALDRLMTPVLVADDHDEVVYANGRAIAYFHRYASAFARELSGFDADDLLGMSLHKLDAELSTALHEQSIHRCTRCFGDRTLALCFTTIRNPCGQSIGTVLEFRDHTARDATLARLDNVLSAARQGDLSLRPGLSADPALAALCGGLDELLGLIDSLIDETAVKLATLADGDLTIEPSRPLPGCFAATLDATEAAAARLRAVIIAMGTSAQELARSTEGFHANIQELDLLGGRTATACGENAARMHALTGSVRENTRRAEEASCLLTAAHAGARNSNTLVEAAIATLTELNAHSTKIADIVGVIDDIAFQTNLLALNASVERRARRAPAIRGEGLQVVVASEVRELAGRSAKAAREIKGLIEHSVSQVDEGRQLVKRR